MMQGYGGKKCYRLSTQGRDMLCIFLSKPIRGNDCRAENMRGEVYQGALIFNSLEKETCDEISILRLKKKLNLAKFL